MKTVRILLFVLTLVPLLRAELRLPAIIGDHMVLQQKQANPIWGWDNPGTKVSANFAGQSYEATAGADGKWTLSLAPAPANSTPQSLTVSGTSTRTIQDILIGEVWMCSGQSNMGFNLKAEYNGDLEAAAANFPNLRLIKVPNVGTQDLKTDFKGAWSVSPPDSAARISAVGFIYGRYLHQILGVPVGLIDNAWSGSAAEAWVRRETLENDPRFKDVIAGTVKREQDIQSGKAKADYEAALVTWNEAVAKAKLENKTPPRAPQKVEAWLSGNARPGNIFAGVLNPTLGYGIKGVIWYQGESNASRASAYATLFPFLIEQWRKEWKQGDFPFYWVQLADFMVEKALPGESAWAELRETQTQTLKVPNTGQAVIIDVGEGRDIHPRNKYAVAARLVRWALVKDYGMKLPYRSPEYTSHVVEEGKVLLSFDCFGSGLRAFDVEEVRGFAICGQDKVWHWAKGVIKGKDKVEVSCPEVAAPLAVRYAWADNPVCNLYTTDGLPVTPFRTDDFEMTTKPKAPQPPKAELAPTAPAPAN